MAKVENIALHSLVKQVDAGKYVEWPWALLRQHFPADNDAEQQAKLQYWAEENGIVARMEERQVRGGKKVYPVRMVVFEPSRGRAGRS